MPGERRQSAAAGTYEPLQRGAPPGSLRYYAVLFASRKHHEALQALYSIDAELRDCGRSGNHDIAHVRLGWWRTELERFAAGEARHPLTLALASAAPARRSDIVRYLGELVVGAELDLARFTYASWHELSAYCFRSAGAVQCAIATVLAAPEPPSEREILFAKQLGEATRQIEMVRDCERDARSGLLYVPLDVLAASRMAPDEWLSGAGDAARSSIRAEWIDRATAALQASSVLTRDERIRQRHGLVLGALHRKLAETMRQGRTEKAAAEISPFTRLWTAWRAAVSAD